MTDYIVKYTDFSNTPITVPEDSVNRTSLGVSLFGRIFQNYGEEVNEALLNVLENFACPEYPSSSNDFDAVPDLSQTSRTQLSVPAIGQLWYNMSRELIYSYDGTTWNPIPQRGLYAANWGQILHGQQLPKPVIGHYPIIDNPDCPNPDQIPDCSKMYDYDNFVIDKEFDYPDCIWSVAPAYIDGSIDSLNCNTNSSAVVTMEYRYEGTGAFVPGTANYLIIGITGNVNNGTYIPPLVPSPTPAPTSTRTPTPTVTMSATPSPSVTPTPVVSLTPSETPAPSVTPTPGVSPTATPTETPPPSVSATPASTPPVTPTPTPFAPMARSGGNMDVWDSIMWNMPCRFPNQSARAQKSGSIIISGGSGSFSYVWTRTPDPASNFTTSISSSGNTFTIQDTAIRSCPYQGGAFGTITVVVTDLVTGLQATFYGTYMLEYTG